MNDEMKSFMFDVNVTDEDILLDMMEDLRIGGFIKNLREVEEE